MKVDSRVTPYATDEVGDGVVEEIAAGLRG